MNDDMHATELGQSEFLMFHTSETDFFPCSCRVCFPSRVYSALKLFQMNQSNRQATVVGHIIVENTCRFKELIVKASVANFRDIGMIWLRNEFFKITETIGFSVGIDQFRLNERFTRLPSGHLQESDKILP